MSKKVILVTGAAGLVSFAGAFAFAWVSGPSAVSGPEGTRVPGATPPKPLRVSDGQQTVTPSVVGAPAGTMNRGLTEQQLKSLVQDLRQKMREYEDRLQAVAMRERRLEVAQNVLKEDIENLDNLRVEVASAVTSLKSERDQLLKSRLEIDQKERDNLVVLAASYDKMNVEGAGKILASMCKGEDGEQPDGTDGGKGNSYDDAVKILHYMTERTKANLLAELATNEPALAANLCQRLKQIVENR